jgi:hypothetical protein
MRLKLFFLLYPFFRISPLLVFPATVTAQEVFNPTQVPFVAQNDPQTHPMAQITNVSQLRDVEPTDWAYEALTSLAERYSCIVGYLDRTFQGNRALSRWEFAAGLNACLNTLERLLQENVAVLAEDIEKLKRLAQEFAAN